MRGFEFVERALGFPQFILGIEIREPSLALAREHFRVQRGAALAQLFAHRAFVERENLQNFIDEYHRDFGSAPPSGETTRTNLQERIEKAKAEVAQ